MRALRPEVTDRRASYYARMAPHIAADPLDFYTRAERGRRFLMGRDWAIAPAPGISLAAVFALARAVTATETT